MAADRHIANQALFKHLTANPGLEPPKISPRTRIGAPRKPRIGESLAGKPAYAELDVGFSLAFRTPPPRLDARIATAVADSAIASSTSRPQQR